MTRPMQPAICLLEPTRQSGIFSLLFSMYLLSLLNTVHNLKPVNGPHCTIVKHVT